MAYSLRTTGRDFVGQAAIVGGVTAQFYLKIELMATRPAPAVRENQAPLGTGAK